MATPLRIDFVSDVTCPWCAIGLHSLLEAIDRIGGMSKVEFHLQPFELNAGMPIAGEPIADYVMRKHGASPADLAKRQALIRQRGAEAGYEFVARTHVYNTFDAHRLLHWAGLQRRSLPLKRVLLAAYHQRAENPASADVLLRAASEVGLDIEKAREVLNSGAHAAEVRAAMRHWQDLGIDSVPSTIIDGRYLISGAQPVEEFEGAGPRRQRLRQERAFEPGGGGRAVSAPASHTPSPCKAIPDEAVCSDAHKF